jgi:hypothetical protein
MDHPSLIVPPHVVSEFRDAKNRRCTIFIADCHDADNAELIVRAVNAHDALVEALGEALKCPEDEGRYALCAGCRAKAIAALKLAKGE